MKVTNHDWANLDGWWESHVDQFRPILANTEAPVLDANWLNDQWDNTDDWWASYLSTNRSTLLSDTSTTLDDRSFGHNWAELDSWWRTYSDARQEDVEELLAAMNMADNTWASSQSQFDTDPLAADWQTAQGFTGPIRLRREENWSFALADLFRSGSGVLISELFDTTRKETPNSVETEAHLPGGSETTRYEDILINLPSGGISIVVKVGDTSLQKTVETAGLVERHYSGDWTHVLLLPAYQHSQLQSTFDEALTQPADGPPIITETPFGNREVEVEVRNWQEISLALRAVLQRTEVLPPHWAASAYVVCTLIEQRILGFTPKPLVERLAATDDVVNDDVSLSVSIGDIESQISYLQRTTEEIQHE